MNASSHGLSSLRRGLAERRRTLGPLVAIFVINALVYALAVRPLGERVANVQERDRTAEQALDSARRDHEAAQGTLTGKERAATELATFYKDVLPADLTGARRLTHLRLAQLARESNLQFERSSFDELDERGSSLRRVHIEMVLRGTYDGMRSFIYQLETASEFVVIDDIGLAEGSDGGELVLTLQLSTYFRSLRSPGP